MDKKYFLYFDLLSVLDEIRTDRNISKKKREKEKKERKKERKFGISW